MPTSYQIKATYRDRENIGAFIDKFGFGQTNVFFMTITFKRNTDKEACASAFNVFRTYFNKNSIRYSHGLDSANNSPFDYVSVWEEHKKGGWHLHILGHVSGASTTRLRAMVRSFLCSTSTCVGFIQVKWTYGHDTNGIKYYVSKYLMKDSRKRGVRYVNYSHGWPRKVALPFAWLGGQSLLWRKACRELFANFSNSFSIFYNNASHSLRTGLIDAWQRADYISVLHYFKRFNLGGLSTLLSEDISDLAKFYDFTGRVVEDTVSDIAFRDFVCWPEQRGFVPDSSDVAFVFAGGEA